MYFGREADLILAVSIFAGWTAWKKYPLNTEFYLGNRTFQPWFLLGFFLILAQSASFLLPTRGRGGVCLSETKVEC